MPDIEYSDGSTAEWPGKLPGETPLEAALRQAKEVDAQYEQFKQQASAMGMGALFGDTDVTEPYFRMSDQP